MTPHLKNATLRGAPSVVSSLYSACTAAAALSGGPWMCSILQQNI
jgi:hypothetical protein